MPYLSDRARRAALGVTVAALLLGVLPVEGAVQVAQPLPEPDKAVSCTMAGTSSEHVVRDADILILDGARVAASERAPGSDPGDPHVCPLHPEQEPVPPRAHP